MSRPCEYCTTITGPVMGNVVRLTNSCVPTVVTIVNRKQLCRRRQLLLLILILVKWLNPRTIFFSL